MKREHDRDWSADFEKAIEESGLAEDLRRCLACGKCAGACPVAAVSPSYNPRQIIREVLLGNPERIVASEEIWRCFWCAGCYSLCPSEIKFPLLMLVLRYFALEHRAGRKYVMPFKRFVERAREDAVTFQPSEKKLDKIRALRSGIGLAPLRVVSEQARREYRMLYDLSGTMEWLEELERSPEGSLGLSFVSGRIMPPADAPDERGRKP